MKLHFILFTLLLLGVLLNACKGTKKTAKADQLSAYTGDKIILFDKPLDSLQTDYFDIDSIAMREQTLFVYVTYGGGCGDVEFEMFYRPQLMTVMPHRKNLALKLSDDDPCRELIQKELTYDLSVFNEEAKAGGVLLSIGKNEFLYSMSEE